AAAVPAPAGGGGATKTAPPPTTTTTQRPAHHAPALPARLVERPTGLLAAALQDGAAAGSLVLGGLDAADTSTSAILLVQGGDVRELGRLPQALHDAAAARIGGAVY